ncbi:DUF1287 domain-containing protein [Salipaludibacillus keqinensis]|uniref:DUF1287 domain-containing protein n=1 Tax=Salipaludibacillus keqinensis TaxID=2045207 RepID=A0A323TNZ4_9BACI|nr:DUF1287 domain-containing protein [Salipaludibacillus keqinensis]PYZ95337.1 DUF1287 domain-containing protein [Salipaludibacillus keqinensis]
MKRKRVRYIFPVFLSILLVFLFFFKDGIVFDSLGIHVELPFGKTVEVPDTYSLEDGNQNGISDPIDIVHAARQEAEQRTTYKSAYYAGGYPPEDEGVCTDVIWRGLMGAGISLKELMDEDIQANTDLYPRVNGNPDHNIDFRRVPNQYVYFERFAESLTKELIPGDIENLKEWQPGDIVVYLDGFHHVGIISDQRAKDGTPYLIHNTRPFAAEIKLTSISTPIAGHYRWDYASQ